MIDCAVCGAPAEVYDTFEMTAWSVNGPEPVTFNRVLCAAGHRYQEENDGR